MKGTHSPDCKHKHMLENEVLPDNFGFLYHLLYEEFHDFDSRIDVVGLSHLVPSINTFFLQMVWVN